MQSQNESFFFLSKQFICRVCCEFSGGGGIDGEDEHIACKSVGWSDGDSVLC